MSEVQNNLGEKFKETIAEAMKTGDFHALNTLVTDTVNDALREADFQANLSREATEKKVWNSQRSWQDKRREEVKTETEIQAEKQTQAENTQAPAKETSTYILNTNSKKFHKPGCSAASQIKAANKDEFTGTRDEVIAKGYEPCKKCNP